MNYYIYLDDVRENDRYFNQHFRREDWLPVVVRNYDEAVKTISEIRDSGKIFLDLDHDLGFDNNNDRAPTGYDFCKYIVQEDIKICGFHIHSMNPVGAANMRQLLSHYGYKEF